MRLASMRIPSHSRLAHHLFGRLVCPPRSLSRLRPTRRSSSCRQGRQKGTSSRACGTAKKKKQCAVSKQRHSTGPPTAVGGRNSCRDGRHATAKTSAAEAAVPAPAEITTAASRSSAAAARRVALRHN
ncbi:hypothetical protein MRX96_019030 [Rhipicephalus microplus]